MLCSEREPGLVVSLKDRTNKRFNQVIVYIIPRNVNWEPIPRPLFLSHSSFGLVLQWRYWKHGDCGITRESNVFHKVPPDTWIESKARWTIVENSIAASCEEKLLTKNKNPPF